MIQYGIKEIILIAQDTARYGMDLYRRKPMLGELLKKIDEIPGDFTYRLLYLYPDVLTKEHLQSMKKLKKFIPYFDIPLQHISPTVLKRMGRFYHTRSINNLLATIKKNFPLSYIRTNIII
jgi:ribosomal protein S12 methylthiotransferase